MKSEITRSSVLSEITVTGRYHMEFSYHETLIPQVNAMPSRSYYIPFADESFSFDKAASPFVELLQEWRFAYFPKLFDGILDAPAGELFEVPFCWQLRGFDRNQYLNYYYPIPFQPPLVLKDNPCGLYSTVYRVPEKSGKYYLNFDGVDSCVYVFVNKRFAGYSSVSHSPVEFDVTELLTESENLIQAVVLKWCAGTYLEDQDKLRMSGIFRDVYMLRRPEEHLNDYRIETDVCGRDGIIRFSADRECELTLSAEGKTLERSAGKKVEFRIAEARLWNAEQPAVYTLVIRCGRELIREFVGIRTISTEGRVFKLNGRPIKFKGVNRHSMTVNGYVESLEDLERDLAMFKRYHINAVRTAHYPPHPLFPVLCDLYGIYVLEEADLEAHGLSAIHSQPEDGFALLSDNPEWEGMYVHRVRRMFERDKNRQCVVMWSLGNESGWGRNFVSAARWLKGADSRPIHYEGAYSPALGGWVQEDCLDVCSRMYPAPAEVKRILGEGVQKPFVLCEYTHAMGNSCGDVRDYWELIYAHEELCGAFVWEWCNHTVADGDRALYGGDFGPEDNQPDLEGSFCVDGLVDTDRTVHPSLLEVAEAYAPAAVLRKGEELILVNRSDFCGLEELGCKCELRVDGDLIRTFPIDLAGIPAGGSRRLSLDAPRGGYVTADFCFCRGGEIVCRSQVVLSDRMEFARSETPAEVTAQGRSYAARGEQYRAAVGEGGMLTLLEGEAPLMDAPMEINVWRAPTDNDRCVLDVWRAAKLNEARFVCRRVACDGNRVRAEGWLAADKLEPILDVRLCYTFWRDRICISLEADKRSWVRHLPRLGVAFRLNPALRQVEYFGRGPGEAYEDRTLACPVGRYTAEVSKMYVSYVRPQENGSHTGSRMVALSGEGARLTVRSERDFSFAVSPYCAGDYRRHAFEMADSGDVWLYVDYRMSGVGSGACGPATDERWLLTEGQMRLDFEIVVERKC